MKRKAQVASVLGVAILLLIGISFFVTTWLAMIVGGIFGHFVNSEWLKGLGYWEYSPIWIVIVILKFMFGGSK